MVVKLGDLCLKQMECITVEEAELSFVQLDHYVSTESESPLQSLRDFPSTHASLDSSLTAIDACNPLAQFQSLHYLHSRSHINATSKTKPTPVLH